MSSTLIVIIAAVAAVAFFVVGMSLTLIFKGHNIQSEISENENMRSRGIKCVIQETRELDGGEASCADCSAGNCNTCEAVQKRK